MEQTNEERIEEALTSLRKEKAEIESRIELIKSIDWTKPVTEDQWHEICETSLRNSPLLATLIQNTFPNAKNIRISSNYAYFTLYDYDIQIPTSRCRGINISTHWWFSNAKYACQQLKEDTHTVASRALRKYYDAVDQKLGWESEADTLIRPGHNVSKFEKFSIWRRHRRWANRDREKFEKVWNEAEEKHKQNLKEAERMEAEIREKLTFVRENLIHELDEFSTKHGSYYGQWGNETNIEDVLKNNNI